MLKQSRDQDIISSIKSGQHNIALNQLYKEAFPIVEKYIINNSGDKEEAKDIFQDAVVAMFTTIKLGRYDESKSINGFLIYVSKNLWINRVKKKNRTQVTDLPDVFESEENPLSAIITEEKRKVIEELMDKVGSKCKELLRYSLYEQLSMKEIAKKMKLSSDTVAKATHYRCKQKLIEIVENDEHVKNLLKR